jgi:hypothetical protein
MANGKGNESGFTGDIDGMLSGKRPAATPAADADYKANLDFAGRVLEARTAPSPTFQSALKQRLVAKLAEMETADESRQAPPVKSWFTVIFSQRTWQVTGALAVLVIASLIVWRIGLFTQGPVVTSPYPTVAVQANANLSKGSYSVGENVGIDFSFKNVSSETLVFLSPPAFSIQTLDGQTVRAFVVGATRKSLSPGESASSSLTWDQHDDAGVQVPAGEYQIVLPNVRLGDAGFLSLTSAPTLVIVSR